MINDADLDIRHIFMTRNPVDNILSYSKLHMPKTFLKASKLVFNKLLLDLYFHFFEFFDENNLALMTEMQSELKKDFAPMKHMALFFGLHFVSYKEVQRLFNVDFFPVTYDELMQDPEEVMRNLLLHCRMPTEKVSHCLEAMAKDTQMNSHLSRERLRDSGVKKDLRRGH